ncbi:MAG: anhydro-N-acetylmuramic acid kinase [Alphaproteobacteria bacterium]
MWVLGLMSGTSLDGVDAALIATDGVTVLDYGPGFVKPLPTPLRSRITAALGSKESTPTIQQLEYDVTLFHAEVVKELEELSGITPELIGFHGQTLYHNPPFTWAIGDGPLLAKLTNCPVVYKLRQNDVDAGGQGAPLAPIYHQALLHQEEQPLAVLNIGGVANITYLDKNTLIAFDVGPGGALIDTWTQQHLGVPFDAQGQWAAQGHCHQDKVQKWLQHPYFAQNYPKSLDREAFSHVRQDLAKLAPVDGAATLMAFTVTGVRLGLARCPQLPRTLWLTGGGRHNSYLVELLQQELSCTVRIIDEKGINGDLLEAQAFAFLAARSIKQLPLSFPLTTGVPHPMSGGSYAGI